MICHMVDHTNALFKRDGQSWYVVAHAAGITEAEIVAGLLRSAGIPVFLFREASSTAIPLSVGPLGGVDVVVPESYYAEATALVDEDDDGGWDELPPTTGSTDGEADLADE
jgi:hypothetical protein